MRTSGLRSLFSELQHSKILPDGLAQPCIMGSQMRAEFDAEAVDGVRREDHMVI